MTTASSTNGRSVLWQPHAGPQTQFLATSVYECLFGGQAGPGKSSCLLMGATRFVHHPQYNGLLLRRTYKELHDSLIPKAYSYFPQIGGKPSDGGQRWTWENGGTISFSHFQHEKDHVMFQSGEWQYIAFDELTHFTQFQYKYLQSRARSAAGLPVMIRSASNPGGLGHEWVLKHWAPWLDKRFDGPRAASGKSLRYRVHSDGKLEWNPITGGFRRMFIRARLEDNPTLMENDPEYRERLNDLPEAERRRLRDGDWDMFEDPNALWRREWFTRGRIWKVPELRRVVIALDPSGSAKKTADNVGLVAAGVGPCACKGKIEDHLFLLEDATGKYAPAEMMARAHRLYVKWGADAIVAEDNFGGEMIKALNDLTNLPDVPYRPNYRSVHASRGKMIRGEPVAAVYEQQRAHHVGVFETLEDTCCSWTPLHPQSPGDLDALVWAGTDLMLRNPVTLGEGAVLEGSRRVAESTARNSEQQWSYPNDDDSSSGEWGVSGSRWSR